MLGWEFFISRVITDDQSDPSSKSEKTFATWITNYNGIRWIENLVKEGKAEKHAANGYPNIYTARAKVILPIIMNGPPHADSKIVIGDDYISSSSWNRELRIDLESISQIRDDEVLRVQAWDQS